MSELLRVILAILLVYRLSHMAALERGPFDLFLRLRLAVQTRLKHKNVKRGGAIYRHWLAEGIECPLCISFWLAVLAPLLVSPGGVLAFFLYWLGAAGAALVLHRSAY